MIEGNTRPFKTPSRARRGSLGQCDTLKTGLLFAFPARKPKTGETKSALCYGNRQQLFERLRFGALSKSSQGMTLFGVRCCRRCVRTFLCVMINVGLSPTGCVWVSGPLDTFWCTHRCTRIKTFQRDIEKGASVKRVRNF